jgi:hypothetical protein
MGADNELFFCGSVFDVSVAVVRGGAAGGSGRTDPNFFGEIPPVFVSMVDDDEDIACFCFSSWRPSSISLLRLPALDDELRSFSKASWPLLRSSSLSIGGFEIVEALVLT